MPEHKQVHDQKHHAIRRATLVPVIAILGVILLVSLGCFYWLQQGYLKNRLADKMNSTPYLLTQFEEQEAKIIAQLFSYYDDDPALIQTFRDGSRQGALESILPVYHRFNEKHEITHFYIHTLDKHCFLRAHMPEMSGDAISRWTLDEAARTGRIAYGIELGPLGTLTLRVVKPWRVGNETIGYLELGKKINFLLPKVKQALGVELVILARKDRLDRSQFEQWSQFRNQVVIDSTLPLLPPELSRGIARAEQEHREIRIHPRGGSPFDGGFIPLLDASGQDIGNILVLVDFSAQQTMLWHTSLVLAMVVCSSGIVFFLLFSARIMRLDKALNIAMLTLENEANHFHALFEESPFPQIEEDFSGVKAYLDGLPCTGLAEVQAYFADHPEAKMECAQRAVMKNCNNSMLRMLRATNKAEVFRDFLCRNFLPRTLDDFLKVVSSLALGARSGECESRLLTDNGEEIAVIVHLQVIAGFEETLAKVAVSFYDITEQKQAEVVMVQAAREWSAAMDASDDVIYLLDLQRHIVRANKTFYLATRSTPETAIGRHIVEVVHPQGEAIPCPVCCAQEEKRDLEIVMEAEHPDNPIARPLEITVKIVRDQEGSPISILMTLHDLSTSRKEIEEKITLERQLQQAQKMEAVGTLAGGVAHDFNNILAAILGFSELAKKSLPPGTAAIDDIDQIISSGKRATALVQQILAFSRKSEQKLQALQPHLIVHEVLQMLRSTLPTTVEIEEEIDPGCGTIMADSTQIYQVVMNLCTNCFQALQDESGILRVTLSRQERRAKDGEEDKGAPSPFIVLSVSDTGQGMDPETASHIFEPYFTTKELGSTKGTGLGLAMVHGIIEGYNGFIEVESEPGKGSTFRVFIPALEQSSATPEELKQDDLIPIGTERILVVDDEPLLVRLNMRLLENYGYTVTGVTDSREALEKVRSDPTQFDLIVTDQTMPGLTGSELAKTVLEIAPGIPIILCTGHSSVISAENALVMGIKRCLMKPVKGDELVRTVRMVLDKLY